MGLRFRNTGQGGVRNIFVQQGMVCFVVWYYKNMRSTDQAKVVHRFLPREVGELLVWYLWLVLPFWQQIQGVIKGGDASSAFLWADEIVSRGAGEGEEGEEGEGQGWEKGLFYKKRWTSDRMKRILQECSSRYLGVRLTISAWRHIAIAISRRYLQGEFKEGGGCGDGDEGSEDEEDEEDNEWDLQAGHGTYVAGMIYGRMLQQGAAGTASRREEFYRISGR